MDDIGERVMEQRRRKIFFIMAMGQVLLLLLILLFCNIKYEVSDDFIMEMVASGIYTGQPDSHIMFSNIFMGWILTLFYHINSTVSWFFWIQMLLCLCAYLAITYVLTHRLRPEAAVFIVILLTSFTARDFYILPQFTKTAIAASAGGLLLIIWGVFYQKKWGICLLGGVLTFFGALVRQKAFYIAVAFAGILVIYESIRVLHYEKWSLRKVICKAWLPGVILLMMVLVCGKLDSLSYMMDSNYSYYREFSKTRSQILDYTWPTYEECQSDFQDIGITENDYSMILEWNFADSDFFNLEKMKQVLQVVLEHRTSQQHSVIEALRMIKARQLHYPITLCCIFLGVFCIAANWRKFWVPTAAAIMAVGFLIYFYFAGRWVYRVEFCFLYCAAVVVAYFCELRVEKKWLNYVICVVTVIAAFLQIPKYLPNQKWKTMDAVGYRRMVYDTYYYSWDYNAAKYTNVVVPGKIHPDFIQTLKSNPDNLYVLDFNTCIQTFYYDFKVFQSSRNYFPQNAVYFAGVTEYHPSVGKHLSEIGCDNLMKTLLNENVYFVSNDSYKIVLQFFHEHGKENVQLEACGEIDGYQIWKYKES